jgi:hypothetical protein
MFQASNRYNGDLSMCTDSGIDAFRKISYIDDVEAFLKTVLGSSFVFPPSNSLPDISTLQNLYPIEDLTRSCTKSDYVWRYIWTLYRLMFGQSFVPDDVEFDVMYRCASQSCPVMIGSVLPMLASLPIHEILIEAVLKTSGNLFVWDEETLIQMESSLSTGLLLKDGTIKVNLTCLSVQIEGVHKPNIYPPGALAVAALLNTVHNASFAFNTPRASVNFGVPTIMKDEASTSFYVTPRSSPKVDIIDAVGTIRITCDVDSSARYVLSDSPSVTVKIVLYSRDVSLSYV